ncbi:hypothetical protein DFH06DRAFT_1477103 [Mycena polygramma]|nr:hypothetical protein DFH06DRAFT_1477103 [Mycena polygramma]
MLTTHRLRSLSALAVTNTTHIDPRHLEYFNYPMLDEEAQATIGHESNSMHVASQHSLYISRRPQLSANESGRTESDGSAIGVLVDLATVLVRLGLHHDAVIPPEYEGQPLATLLQDFKEGRFEVDSRFFAVDSLLATSLWEAKHGPTRHPQSLLKFANGLANLMNQARTQALDQGMFLFTCPLYGAQKKTYLVAVAGEYMSFRLFTRAEARTRFGVWMKRHLENREAVSEGTYIVVGDSDADLNDAPAWDHPELEKYDQFVDPGLAESTKAKEDKVRAKRRRTAKAAAEKAKTLAEKAAALEESRAKRDARHARRVEMQSRAEARESLGDTKPNPDRSVQPFTDEALNDYWVTLTTVPSGVFMETRSAREVFGAAGDDRKVSEWSGIVRIGTALAATYLEEIYDYNATEQEAEERRREKIILNKELFEQGDDEEDDEEDNDEKAEDEDEKFE